MKIAWIGLGAMGAPMAHNLLKAGFELTVFNRSREKTDVFLRRGAKVAPTPAQAASESEIVITMLSNDQAIEDVVFGGDGVLAGLKPNCIHVSMSTVSIGIAKKMEHAHREKGQHYLSAPVMGRPEAAAGAMLRILMAGNPAVQSKAKPVMQALGQEVFSLGAESWYGNAVKIGMNFLLASMVESLSESQSLADHLGIERAMFMEVVNAVFQSPVYKLYGDIIMNGQFDPPGFQMKLGAKDVGLSLNAANVAGTEMPLAKLLELSFQKGIADGHENLDWTAISLNYAVKRK